MEQEGIACPYIPESRLGRERRAKEPSLGKSSWLPGQTVLRKVRKTGSQRPGGQYTSPSTWRPRGCDLPLAAMDDQCMAYP